MSLWIPESIPSPGPGRFPLRRTADGHPSETPSEMRVRCIEGACALSRQFWSPIPLIVPAAPTLTCVWGRNSLTFRADEKWREEKDGVPLATGSSQPSSRRAGVSPPAACARQRRRNSAHAARNHAHDPGQWIGDHHPRRSQRAGRLRAGLVPRRQHFGGQMARRRVCPMFWNTCFSKAPPAGPAAASTRKCRRRAVT